MKLLKQRIIPALIMVVVTLGALIPLSIFGPKHFEARIVSLIIFASLLAVLSYEFFNAMRLKLYFSLPLALMVMLTILFPLWKNNPSQDVISTFINVGTVPSENLKFLIQNIAQDWISIIILLVVSLAFFIIELATRKQNLNDRLIRVLHTLISIYVLSISIKSFMVFVNVDYKYWLLAVLIPICHDTLGFFGGKLYGRKVFKKPFSQVISPNKTWEGFIAGVFGALVIASILVFALNMFDTGILVKTYILKIFFILIVPVVAAFGDLYFSLIKRLNGVKDYSKILAGHGGFLDRFDGISFVTFFIFLTMMFW
ncbi:phosphatidate cytidylyltransferase [Mycoplasmopsis iners]|uniref:phosphatidate cytidylyltransferase n=1 Tax=Mycoplasmopsis iners TaxID=76630 RepID=UPI000495B26A|nr:phosphatidate cytidylyltransferase [Mycoplasmopsis iners]